MDGILSANTTSRMESSANGMTFFGNVVGFIFLVLCTLALFFARKVRLKSCIYPPVPSSYPQAQDVKIEQLTPAFYINIAALPASTCFSILCNREAQAFVLRKIRCTMANNTVAPTHTSTDNHRMINLRL